MSGASGSGKSIAIRALVAQALHHGAIVLVLDIKRLSHSYLRGLPNVRYCKSVEEIHAALLWLGGEVLRRAEVADEGADLDGETDHVNIGPRCLIVVEELNATAQRLNAHWRAVRGKDDAKTSPAVECLADVSYMGRQVKCHLIVAGQMTSARALGGGEIRESFGYRLLGRWSLNAWRMLAGEVWPPPKATRHKGRWQAVCGGQATEVQVAYLTSAEARALATSGIVVPFPDTSEMTSSAAVTPLHLVPAADGEAGPVGLRQAIAEGVLTVPEDSTPVRYLAAVRKARQYDAEFPAPVDQGGPGGEHRYARAELAAWARNRPRAAAATSA